MIWLGALIVFCMMYAFSGPIRSSITIGLSLWYSFSLGGSSMEIFECFLITAFFCTALMSPSVWLHFGVGFWVGNKLSSYDREGN